MMYSTSVKLTYFMFLLYMVMFTQWNEAQADCKIVSKTEWHGARSKHLQYLPQPMKAVVVLATDTDSCMADASCEYIVKNIQKHHIEELGYHDIAPAFLIGGNGKIYEGSGWLHVGNHTKGYGQVSLGIALIGNFKDARPNVDALDALQDLLECGVSERHLTPDYSLFVQSQLLAEHKGENHNKLYAEIKKLSHWKAQSPIEWISISSINILDNLHSKLPFIPQYMIEELKEELTHKYRPEEE